MEYIVAIGATWDWFRAYRPRLKVSIGGVMPDNREMRRLTAKWSTGAGWPKRLEWIRIDKIRGWNNERIDLRYPITAIVGENGVGKSTILQAIASIYKSKPPMKQGARKQPRKAIFASDHFPDTTWETVAGTISYAVRQGPRTFPKEQSLRKLKRWRGYKDRPDRQVIWIDLSRIQPVSARPGYYKLANPIYKEDSCVALDTESLERLGNITGKNYEVAKMAYLSVDKIRPVPVLQQASKQPYSGWHQGNGETVLAELMQLEIPQYSIVLIDEIESSLHPRLQRRLIHDLAKLALKKELQIVLTTHSPFILEELPPDARLQISDTPQGKRTLYGVTAEFAMSSMDDVPQYECDLYVEDERAQRMVIEIIAERAANRESVLRCKTTTFGTASVGQALGIMKSQNRFHRPTFVFLDGEQEGSPGCIKLPGDEAPERVVFEALQSARWHSLHERIKRSFSDVADACLQAMFLPDHHDWIKFAADKLVVGADTLWQAMCSEWAAKSLDAKEAARITQPIEDALNQVLIAFKAPPPPVATVTPRAIALGKAEAPYSSEPMLLFEQSESEEKE